jgi:hypothetical protein
MRPPKALERIATEIGVDGAIGSTAGEVMTATGGATITVMDEAAERHFR